MMRLVKKNPYLIGWVVSVIYIIYGTLIPFDISFNIENIIGNIKSANYIPFYHEVRYRHIAIPDIISNICVYTVYGFLLRTGLEPYYVSRCGLKCISSGLLLSIFVEILQLFSVSRITSITDIINNTIGTWIGCILAIVFIKYIKDKLTKKLNNLKESEPYIVHILVYSLILMIIFMFPFDISIDVEDVQHNIKNMYLFPFYYNDTFNFSVINISINALSFSIVGFLGYKAFTHYYDSRLIGIISTLFFGMLLAVFIEATQIFVVSRVTDISNVFSRVIGVFLGIFPGMISYNKLE
jgi:VanZ family protein